MKLTLKNLSLLAVISFALSFVTGMSATIMYQEHMALKPYMATELFTNDLIAETNTENFYF